MSAQRTFPIVLAHGIARFDFLRESIQLQAERLFGVSFDNILSHLNDHGIHLHTDNLHYFRGIRSQLEDEGFVVRQTNVGFATSLESRAHNLKSQIEGVLQETRGPKVHIIGHSMGGLDSRFIISKLGMADRIASLTTIGTPHFGSSFADAGVAEGGTALLDAVSDVIDVHGLEDLTSKRCDAFNASVAEDEPKNPVFYQTYASAEERDKVFSVLQPSWDVITKAEGPNDGLVSLVSQAWVSELIASDGTKKTVPSHTFPLPADHLNEVGWWDLDEMRGTGPFNKLIAKDAYERQIRQVYSGIARDLRAQFPT
jgi:triacylglycerol lipase